MFFFEEQPWFVYSKAIAEVWLSYANSMGNRRNTLANLSLLLASAPTGKMAHSTNVGGDVNIRVVWTDFHRIEIPQSLSDLPE